MRACPPQANRRAAGLVREAAPRATAIEGGRVQNGWTAGGHTDPRVPGKLGGGGGAAVFVPALRSPSISGSVGVAATGHCIDASCGGCTQAGATGGERAQSRLMMGSWQTRLRASGSGGAGARRVMCRRDETQMLALSLACRSGPSCVSRSGATAEHEAPSPIPAWLGGANEAAMQRGDGVRVMLARISMGVGGFAWGPSQASTKQALAGLGAGKEAGKAGGPPQSLRLDPAGSDRTMRNLTTLAWAPRFAGPRLASPSGEGDCAAGRRQAEKMPEERRPAVRGRARGRPGPRRSQPTWGLALRNHQPTGEAGGRRPAVPMMSGSWLSVQLFRGDDAFGRWYIDARDPGPW